MKHLLAAAALSLMVTTPLYAAGDDFKTVQTDAEFADVAQSVSDAIINRGYTIDYHGFVGEMLKRTAEDVGADKKLYKNAEFFTFCSAVLSRKVFEADITDIAYCPYVVVAYETEDNPGKVTVGYRSLPEGGVRDEVNALLGEIIKEAAEGF